eukprot:TRINITY_DN3226_c0_g2_i2.p1 TRINITY_DN3226_c0_g2~~TRINITY_DN3226_c0_g2_i2.p1  ORF type:complete len:2497 (+),score=785.39 TRINITY_DN3226_c0_g2_i2:92-7582(+)
MSRSAAPGSARTPPSRSRAGSAGASRRRPGDSVVPYVARPSEPSTRGASPIRRRGVHGADPLQSGGGRTVYSLVPVSADIVEEEQLPFPSSYTRATTGTTDVRWEVRASGSRKWQPVAAEDVEQLEVAFQVNANALEMPVQGAGRGALRTYHLQKTANWNGEVPACVEPDGSVLALRRVEGVGSLQQRPPGFTHFSAQFVRRHTPKLTLPLEGFFCGTQPVKDFTGCEAACAEVASTGCVWTGERDGTLRIWNAKTNERVRTTEQKKDIYCTALLEVPAAGAMWAGFSDGVIRVFNVRHPYEVQMSVRRHASGSTIYCLAPQIGGHCVFSGGQDNMIYMWDANTLEWMRTFSGHARAVRGLLADADRLYSVSDDGTLAVWDIYGRDRLEWTGHASGVHHIVKTDRHIWTGGEDGTVRVWDVESGDSVQVYAKPHEEKINAMALIGDKVWTSSGASLFMWDARNLREEPVGQYSQNHVGYVKNIIEVHRSLMVRVWTTGKEGKVQVWDCECSADWDADDGLRIELEQRKQEVVQLKERLQRYEAEANATAADHAARVSRLKAENEDLTRKLTSAAGDIAALRKELEQARREVDRAARAAAIDAEKLAGRSRELEILRAQQQRQQPQRRLSAGSAKAQPSTPVKGAPAPAGAAAADGGSGLGSERGMGPETLPSVSLGTHDGRPLLLNDSGELLRHGGKLCDAQGRPITWAGRGARPVDGDGRSVVGVTEDGVPILLARGDEPHVLPVGPGGRPLAAHGGRTVIEPLGGRPQLIDGTMVLCGPDGRPPCTDDGRVAIINRNRNLEGPDGQLIVGPDGRTPVTVDERGHPHDSRGPVEIRVTPDGRRMIAVIPPGTPVDQQVGARQRAGSRATTGGVARRPAGASVGPDGRTVVGPEGSVLVGDDGRPLTVDASGMACTSDDVPVSAEQLEEAVQGSGAADPPPHVVDAGGLAVLGPDGAPVVVGRDGTLSTAAGAPLSKEQTVSLMASPGRKTVMGPDGRAVLGPDGRPLTIRRDGAACTQGGVPLSREEVASSMGLTASPRSHSEPPGGGGARADVIRKLEGQVRQLRAKLAQSEADGEAQRALAASQDERLDSLAQQLRDQAAMNPDDRAAAAERRLADLAQKQAKKEQETASREGQARERAARESDAEVERLRGQLAAAQREAERQRALVKARDARIALLSGQMRDRARDAGTDDRAAEAEEGLAQMAQQLAAAESEVARLQQQQDQGLFEEEAGRRQELQAQLTHAEGEADRQRALVESLDAKVAALVQQLSDQAALSGDERAAAAERRLAELTARHSELEQRMARDQDDRSRRQVRDLAASAADLRASTSVRSSAAPPPAAAGWGPAGAGAAHPAGGDATRRYLLAENAELRAQLRRHGHALPDGVGAEPPPAGAAPAAGGAAAQAENARLRAALKSHRLRLPSGVGAAPPAGGGASAQRRLAAENGELRSALRKHGHALPAAGGAEQPGAAPPGGWGDAALVAENSELRAALQGHGHPVPAAGGAALRQHLLAENSELRTALRDNRHPLPAGVGPEPPPPGAAPPGGWGDAALAAENAELRAALKGHGHALPASVGTDPPPAGAAPPPGGWGDAALAAENAELRAKLKSRGHALPAGAEAGASAAGGGDSAAQQRRLIAENAELRAALRSHGHAVPAGGSSDQPPAAADGGAAAQRRLLAENAELRSALRSHGTALPTGVGAEPPPAAPRPRLMAENSELRSALRSHGEALPAGVGTQPPPAGAAPPAGGEAAAQQRLAAENAELRAALERHGHAVPAAAAAPQLSYGMSASQSAAPAPGGSSSTGGGGSPTAGSGSAGGSGGAAGAAHVASGTIGLGTHDGHPLELGSRGEVLWRGRPLLDQQGQPVMCVPGQRPTDSAGRPVVGVTDHGVPVLIAHEQAYVLPVGASGQPMTSGDGRQVIEPLGGRPQLEDGTPVVCGQDGRPLCAPDGKVCTVARNGMLQGPDGQAVVGPDGTPLRIDDGGRPCDSRGPVDLVLSADGRRVEGVVPPGTPVDQTLGRSREPSGIRLPGTGAVGPDGRTVIGPDGCVLVGPDARPVLVNAEGLAVAASTGEPLGRDEFRAALSGSFLPAPQSPRTAGSKQDAARLEAENAELRSQLALADSKVEQSRGLAASHEGRLAALAQQLRDQASLSGDERAAAAERRLADMTERLAKREEELAEADARRRAALEEDFRRKRELLEKQRQEEVENLRSFTEQRDVDMRHHSDRQRELISHIHQREDNIKSAEEDMQRRAAMQANLSPSELVHYYKYKEEQWAQIGGLNRQLHAENAALLGQTRDLQDRLQSLQFVIESRPSFLKVLYDLYKMCVHTRKNLDRFSKEVSARERPRRELLDNISEVRNEVVDVMNGNKWLIGNMFTEYELLHIGTSPSFFVPDAKRFNRFRPAGFGSVPATGRWSRTPTPNVGLPHGHDMNAASPRGSVPRRTGSPHPAGATHSPVSGEFPSGRLASPQRLQRETSYQSHADVVYAAV